MNIEIRWFIAGILVAAAISLTAYAGLLAGREEMKDELAAGREITVIKEWGTVVIGRVK